MLTGKCKENFEKWLFKGDNNYGNIIGAVLLEDFYSNGLSMQYGVYVDFFDSVGIEIEIDIINTTHYGVTIMQQENGVYSDEYEYISEIKNRQEAWEEAIKRANILYNDKRN